MYFIFFTSFIQVSGGAGLFFIIFSITTKILQAALTLRNPNSLV